MISDSPREVRKECSYYSMYYNNKIINLKVNKVLENGTLLLYMYYIYFGTNKLILYYFPCSRLYNWFAFVLFFYNGIAGFVSAILRTIMSSLFSLILLFRLDQVILIKGFERFDIGK